MRWARALLTVAAVVGGAAVLIPHGGRATAEDQPVTTTRPNTPPPAAAPTASDPVAQLDAIPDAGSADAPGPADRKPHGQVSMAVGTHGYRQGGGSVEIPTDGGTVAMSIEAGQVQGRR